MAMRWEAEANGWVAHPTIGAWNEVPLAGPYALTLWRRLLHSCEPWSIGVHGYFAEMQVTERCWCGGVREGVTVGMVHAWRGPDSPEPLAYEHQTWWRDRFSRYRGTAVFYRPTLRCVHEEVA